MLFVSKCSCSVENPIFSKWEIYIQKWLSYLPLETGWNGVDGQIYTYEKSQISTPGRVDSFLRGSKVRRTRYANQITLKVLLQLSKEAFDNPSSCEYNEWVNERKAASTSAYYWCTAVEMIATLFMFVRSIRESNYINYVNILKVMMPCFFALDHVNYSRYIYIQYI